MIVEQSLEADDAALAGELRGLGFAVDSVYDFVNTSSPYPAAYPLLVKHLSVPHHPRVREGIIRALTIKDARPVAEAALLQGFKEERDPILKWTFANALRTVMPYRSRRKYPEIAAVLYPPAAP